MHRIHLMQAAGRPRLLIGRFSYHFRRVESMQAMSGRPSLLRSATAQAAAPMPPSSRIAARPLAAGVVAVKIDAARLRRGSRR